MIKINKLLAVASLSLGATLTSFAQQVDSKLFGFKFELGASRSATLSGTGFTVSSVFTNLPTSTTAPGTGSIDDGTIAITSGFLFVDRGPGITFSNTE